jgi:hypothetical protein
MAKPWTHVDAGLRWREWELAKLERLLRRFKEWEPVFAHFDNRSPRAVETKALRLFRHLCRGGAKISRDRRFTPAEDEVIRARYRDGPVRELAARLGRKRNAVISRMNQLRKLDKRAGFG